MLGSVQFNPPLKTGKRVTPRSPQSLGDVSIRQESSIGLSSQTTCHSPKGGSRMEQLSDLRTGLSTERPPHNAELPSSSVFESTEERCCLGLVDCEPDLPPD